ncbi:MAG TPA: hypothetical protein DEP51_04230 [Clostridiales bacterium]|nr:hypothetical protein [Clostridiales bacterium]
MRKNKGITMISLVITIIVLLILTSITIYNGLAQLGIKRVNNLYADIDSISTKVAEYYLKNETIPIYNDPYVNNKDELKAIFTANGASDTEKLINVNDEGAYYVIDLSKLDNLTLNYGDDYKTWNSSEPKSQNVYIINTVTHQIYFPHGVRSGDEYYFARFPDEDVISPIALEEIEDAVSVQILQIGYKKLDKLKEALSVNILVNLGEEYQTNSLKYAWSDTNDSETINTLMLSDFSLDNENKATLMSLPLDSSQMSHYLLIEVTDNNGQKIKKVLNVEKKLFAILYSNNSDNTDLELVFNSTGELDDSGRTTLLQTGNIINSSFSLSNKPQWTSNKAKIKTVTIENQIFPRNTSLWFLDCTTLTQINGIENLDTSNVQSMSQMFAGCKNLASLDVSRFDTSNVNNMFSLFAGCEKLEYLDLSNFDTSKVTNMENALNGMKKIKNLDLRNFDTSNVDNMHGLFYGDNALESVNVSSFNTSKVKKMSNMFADCSMLSSLDISNFNTSSVTDMKYMFSGCKSLTSLDVSNFDTSNVETMTCMFAYCESLTSLDLSAFNTSQVTTMNTMFSGCKGLTSLDLSGFNNSQLKNMYRMFMGCTKLTNIDLSSFNTNQVTNMESMFNGCSGLTSLDLSNFNTSQVTNMVSMFNGCSGLTSLNLSSFNTSQVTNMQEMFRGCSRLTSLDLSGFNTSQVSNMNRMFYTCSGLTSIDVSGFNTSQVNNMGEMFRECTKLTSLDLSSFNTSQVTNMGGMFHRCYNITTIYAGDNWNVDNVTNSTNMFYGCTNVMGDIAFNSSYLDKTYAKTTGGYLTYKAPPAP